MSPINPSDTLAIQNTLARYCVALDTKNFDLLDKVFNPDVVAGYPFHAEDFRGVEAVKGAIKERLGPILTHHSLTTQTIIFPIDGDGKTAKAVTYFFGCHFGQGPHEGKVLQAYGRYEDELVCLSASGYEADDEGGRGASGIWRIRKRVVGFTKRIGEEAIMREF